MIKSMTGFGRAELSTEIGHFTVEARSVNNKSCNIVIKLSETLSSLENQIAGYVRSVISRGYINISVSFSKDETVLKKTVKIDQELAKEYCEQLRLIKDHLSLSDPVSLNTIAAMPGVINVEEPVENVDEIWPFLREVLGESMEKLVQMRGTEGAAMLRDLSDRLGTMAQLADAIGSRAPQVVEEYRERLSRRVSDLLRDQAEIDQSRLAMEVAVMAERSDITEELVRLRSHISQLGDCLKNSEGPIGRQLDFILQEVNREVNTIASKASDYEISADCIRFKDETEKMREQVQNIE